MHDRHINQKYLYLLEEYYGNNGCFGNKKNSPRYGKCQSFPLVYPWLGQEPASEVDDLQPELPEVRICLEFCDSKDI